MDSMFTAKLPKALTTASETVFQFLQANRLEDVTEKIPLKLWGLIHSLYCFISRLHPKEVEDKTLLVRDCRVGDKCEMASHEHLLFTLNDLQKL